jgi:hypothetical protein
LRSPLVEIGLDISAWLKMTEFGCDCCEAWVAMTALDKVKRSLSMKKRSLADVQDLVQTSVAKSN